MLRLFDRLDKFPNFFCRPALFQQVSPIAQNLPDRKQSLSSSRVIERSSGPI